MTTVVAGRDARLTVLSVLGYISIGAIVAVALGCVLVALLRGRAALAFGAAVALAGANVTTQVLKESVLQRPDLGLGTFNSLPSGHTTVVASAVGAALLVVPSVLRAAVATVGGFATTLTGASTIAAGWHRPADVVAALAVSLAWTAGVAAVLHGPRQRVSGVIAGALLGCVAALAFLILVGVRPCWAGTASSRPGSSSAPSRRSPSDSSSLPPRRRRRSSRSAVGVARPAAVADAAEPLLPRGCLGSAHLDPQHRPSPRTALSFATMRGARRRSWVAHAVVAVRPRPQRRRRR